MNKRSRFCTFAMDLALGALTLVLGAASASAETLLMPPRDFAGDQIEVVWGISTLPNGTAYTIDFGDGTPVLNGNVVDRSYIAFTHTFAPSGTPYTVTLTVGAEVATTEVKAFDTTAMTAAQVRDLNVNRAIEDGLRALWYNHTFRTTFDTATTGYWSGPSFTSLVVLAFMNHGYTVPNDDSVPTGIYQKYAVQRGLRYVLSTLSTIAVNANTPNGGNPCEGIGGGGVPCTLFSQNERQGYSTSIAILPFAASNALNRTSDVVGATSGMAYRDVLQRLVNGLAWGQNDSGTGRGGWNYGFNSTVSDGSTIGWNMLALLDAAAGGITIPSFVKGEFQNNAFANAKNVSPADLNNDGTFDYNADGNPLSGYFRNTARVGIGLQSAFYVGDAIGDTYVDAAVAAVNRRWSGAALSGDYGSTCASGVQNKGCGYAMFNIFKGLKLFGVNTLADVNRPGGTVGDPDDWYADYVDWLVNNQRLPQTTTGGFWMAASGANTNRFGAAQSPMYFSCCSNDTNAITALAELILAPVALVLPDPIRFSAVGLSPAASSGINGTDHTVTAEALSTGGTPVPGATVDFEVLSGPNAGKMSTGTTGADGKTTFTYTDTVGDGTDTIQAFIGALGSNQVTRTWGPEVIKCDADGDRDIDRDDLLIIRAANRQDATGPNDPRDGNGDGTINVADVRFCQLAIRANTAAAKAAARAARVR